MNILKSGGTLFLAYEVRMGRATVLAWQIHANRQDVVV